MLMGFVVLQAALAHLESLAIDVEQAHPPATEQIIDCLPQITVHAENIGTTVVICRLLNHIQNIQPQIS